MTILKATIKAYCVTLAICLGLLTGAWTAAGVKKAVRLHREREERICGEMAEETILEIEAYLEEKGGN